MLSALPADRARDFRWSSYGPAARVAAVLEDAAPGAARFVGGCVRDSLAGIAPKDVDIATTLVPDKVTAIARAAHLKVVATGPAHGVVTVIVDGVGVEVATLRADIATDGRRAVVAFTEDWRTDAERRDFTINAIYLTPDGYLYDPVGGVADLYERRVRFIGDARERIREDYLRILRFFRFSARFADDLDDEGLAACQLLHAGLSRLSAERIGDEFTRILEGPNAIRAVRAMHNIGALRMIWPGEPALSALARLRALDEAPPCALSLAALYQENDCRADGETIDDVLRLPKKVSDRRRRAVENASEFANALSQAERRARLYRLGVRDYQDGVMLAYACATLTSQDAARDLLALPSVWRAPAFPLRGRDVLARGVPAGPRVAETLKRVENLWVNAGFPDETRLEELVDQAVEETR